MKHLLRDPSVRRALLRAILVCNAPAKDVSAASIEIAVDLARISAGATLIPIKGIWASDGSLDRDRYEGPFEIADGVAIEITITHDRLEELYRALPPIVSAACRRFDLPAEWIHTDIEINGQRFAGHFQIGSE